MDLPNQKTDKKTHTCTSFTGTTRGKKGQFIELDQKFDYSWMTKAQAKTIIASLKWHIERIDKYDKAKRGNHARD
ncbi:MAG: hypothetical protein KAQ85_00845 [Thermodesulfovibrionia bacterium]|nr:hypothetical protein [Thermodesulfovibrionia bacterium]